jgi:hypothetical protein
MTKTGSRRRLEADIQGLSRAMQRLLGAAALLYPVVLAAYVFGGARQGLAHPWAASLRAPEDAQALAFQGDLFVGLALAAAPLVWGFWRLSRMFAAYAAGEGLVAAREFERFAWSLAATAIAEPLASVAFALLLRAQGLASRPELAIQVSSTGLIALLLGLVLGVVAKVMRMAALLARENAEYV